MHSIKPCLSKANLLNSNVVQRHIGIILKTAKYTYPK